MSDQAVLAQMDRAVEQQADWLARWANGDAGLLGRVDGFTRHAAVAIFRQAGLEPKDAKFLSCALALGMMVVSRRGYQLERSDDE